MIQASYQRVGGWTSLDPRVGGWPWTPTWITTWSDDWVHVLPDQAAERGRPEALKV